MDVTFIQTADAFNYKAMLDITSSTVVEYCKRKSYLYESFVGIKRGFYPWQASFNRLFMLKAMVDNDYRGWVVYMDADAFVHDLDFDFDRYLADKRNYAGILTPVGIPPYWDINTGVMVINLAHPTARDMISAWYACYAAVSDADLLSLREWPGDINDQMFLHTLLDKNTAIRDAFLYQDSEILNHPYGTFIRQILRAYIPNQSDRVEVVRTAVEEALGHSKSDLTQKIYPLLMSNLFRVLLHRDVDGGALDHFRSRFIDKGIDTAFRETFAEILISREYLDLHEVKDPRCLPVETQLKLAYVWILGRDPDKLGMNGYLQALKAGHITLDEIRQDMLTSTEFNDKLLSIINFDKQ